MVSMLTIGTGDVPAITTSERILVLVLVLVGACVNAYCVGAMVNFLIDPIGADFLQSFSGLWTYLKFKRIPEDLRTEVLNVFQDKWNTYEGASDPRAVFKFIPETVRDRMKLDIVRTCVMRITFMYMSSEKLLVAFANVLKPFTACPDEVVIREGDVVPVLFLFRSGIIRSFCKGALFAETNCDVGVALGD
jgi:voltage-gated potassium channel